MVEASWLRGLGERDLAALVERRPEVTARSEPRSLADLAQRLGSPPAVVAALRRLDRPTLQVAEAMAALGGDPERHRLDRLLGVPATGTAHDVERALATLREHALLSGPGLVDAARQVWLQPLGLGRPAAELFERKTADELRAIAGNLGLRPPNRRTQILAALLATLRDPRRVSALVDGGPADARELLHRVARDSEPAHDYIYFNPRFGKVTRPEHWAQARGLLVRLDWDSRLSMPAEVALALRGPAYVAPFEPVAPAVPRVAVADESVARDADAVGMGLLRLVTALLDEAGRAALTTLRSGGVGVRELRRLAKLTGCPVERVRLGLALAFAAGLLELSAEEATPTTRYDDWLTAAPAERLAELVLAWWGLPYCPSVDTGAAWAPVALEGTAELRATVLRIAGTPRGTAVADPHALVARARWCRPYARSGLDAAAVALACWQEAGLLGLRGAEAVSPAGHGLLGGDHRALVTALAGVGGVQRAARIQADLTAVVLGHPAAELAGLLDAVADREARGTAATWRFTPGSVRRALDAGLDAPTLLTRLSTVAEGGVPQPLDYLVRDVARRHGAVRASEVACCLRAHDAVLLAEIAADRRLRKLGLRTLAPTVLASAEPLPETLAALRSAGYAPLGELPDGTPMLERAAPRRAPTRSAAGGAGAAGAAGAAPAGRIDPRRLARTLLDRPDVQVAARSPDLVGEDLVGEHLLGLVVTGVGASSAPLPWPAPGTMQ